MNKEIVNFSSESAKYDLVCLSHLRWDFVYQRPQHLLSRFGRQEHRVFFCEEPIFHDGATHLDISAREDNLFVVVPRISHRDRETGSVTDIQRALLAEMSESNRIENYILWFYTPMAMDFAADLQPLATVFDCMDELSAFKFAPPELIENERRLLDKTDLVFTGGQSLYEAKKDKHPRVFAFPSSIDAAHFEQARNVTEEPPDQQEIGHPRLGYYGVIDERIDLALLDQAAEQRPEWQFVVIGPVVKISEADLPRRANIHYLGSKSYQELPAYLGGWEVALMPFALNDSTKYISPTKTPEYLAAGKPVVSTPIRDVVRPYGESGLVHIAATAAEFVAACEKALEENAAERIERADKFLASNSWDITWSEMAKQIDEAIAPNGTKLAKG